MYLVVDTETGGLFPDQYDCIQAGFILADDNLNEVWAHEFKISRLEYRTSPEAMAVNKLNLEECRIKGLPLDFKPFNKSQGKALEQFEEMMSYLINLKNNKIEVRLMAHNVPFDKGFIEATLPQIIKNIGYRSVDTIGVALAVQDAGKLPTKNVKLETLTEYFGIKHEGAHTALVDARACLEVYKKLIEIIRG